MLLRHICQTKSIRDIAQPLRKFVTQGDARLFADMIREHKVPTPADVYARTYDKKRVVSCMTRTSDGKNFKFKLINV